MEHPPVDRRQEKQLSGREDRARKAENGRETTDAGQKDRPGLKTENDQASTETKRYLTATVHIRPATAAPASPPPCNITAARQTKENFMG